MKMNGNYAKNKKASVNIIQSLNIPTSDKQRFENIDKKKRDDVADAMLIALYWFEKGMSIETQRSKKRRRLYKD